MILFDKNTLNGKPIIAWEVRFHTLLGFHKTVEEAILAADETDMPRAMIRPVPCAIAADEWEPVFR